MRLIEAPPAAHAPTALWRLVRLAVVTFAIVFGSAYCSILVTRGAQDLAPVWPANAIVLVLLLRAPARTWARLDLIVAAGLGSVMANWLGGSSLPLALWFTLANGVEVFAAFALIRRGERAGSRGDAREIVPRPLKYLLRAGLLAPALGATIAALGLVVFAHAEYGASWLDWFLTAALGMMIVAPLGVSVTRENWRPLKTGDGLRSALVCALLVGGATSIVFMQDNLPLLFLITPAILRAAYVRRALGAAAAVTLTALIAVPLTQAGHGPLSLMQSAGAHDRQFLLQLFLLSQSLIALAIAAALDERDALKRAVEAREHAAVENVKAKSRLLTGVAHDIRTPLNAILGLGDLLAKSQSLSDHERRLVEGMVGASGQLQSLANDLLDRSRIESGALVLAPDSCNAAILIDDILAEARRWPEAEGVTLRASAPKELVLWADPERARQVLRNLVSNAVKYAGGHGPILVRAYGAGDRTRLEVRDHGPGVTLAHQHEVFEPFARIGAAGVTAKSAGVGLSLVKLLAEAQGGVVGMASTPFVETRFWADFPSHAPTGRSQLAAIDEPGDIDPELIFGAAPAPIARDER